MEPKFDQVVVGLAETDTSPTEVRIALDHILASNAFSRAERPGRFLRHLVESALEGNTGSLKESTLGCDVFGRSPDWDPRLEPIVRQEAARLRKRIARYYESHADADPVRISLPVGTYVPRFEKQSASLSAVSNGHDRPTPSITSRPRFWFLLRYLVPSVVLFVLIAGVYRLWNISGNTSAVSLAVLPFQNVSADPADQYFSDGVTEELTDLMSRYAKVRTVARTQTSKFRTVSSLRSVAEQLRVSYLVRGTVERKADQLNITASLLRGSDGASLWTNTYRRHGADLNAIEEDLSSHLATALGLHSPATAQEYHVPPVAAHDLFLRGRFEARQTTLAANAQAQIEFREALKLDPSYDLAYIGLAQAIWNENIWAGTTPLLSERRKTEELWEKALELDPRSAPAHSGLAMYAMQYDWDWARAERELKAVISADDSSNAENSLATLYLIRGHFREANSHMERAKLLDPDSLGRMANSITQLNLEGRFEEARIVCEQWLVRSPASLNPKFAMAQILAQQGKIPAALKILSALPKDAAGLNIALAQIKAIAGAHDEARRILTSLESSYPEGRQFAYDFAVAYAELNDAPNAVRWMRRSIDAREGPAIYIRVEPQLASVQNDPNFRALKKQMDLDW